MGAGEVVPQNPTDPNWGAAENPTDPNWGLDEPSNKGGHDFKVLGVNIHVPGEEKPRLDSNMVGWGTEGSGIAPEDVMLAGRGVGLVRKAASAGGALAGAKEAISQASPIVKYEVTKATLQAAGVPAPLAMATAMLFSGYRRGQTPPTPEVPAAAEAGAPHLDLSQRIQPGDLTQQQIGERIAAARASGVSAPMPERVKTGPAPTRVPLPEQPAPAPVPAPAPPPRPVTTGTSMTPAPMPVRPAPAPVEPAPVAPAQVPAAVEPAAPVVAPGPKLSPQRAMNDLAIAARRAKTTLSAEDYDALKPLVQDGTPASDAVAALVKTRVEADPAAQFAARFNLPSDAERTFPPNKSGLPTKAPRADAKAKATATQNQYADIPAELVKPAAENPYDAAGAAAELNKLRDIKPRPIDKLYGKNGPTPEQQTAWDAAIKEWNRKYRAAVAKQKSELAKSNEWFEAHRP